MAVVEASPDKVIVRRGVSALSCVNHFQSGQLKNKNRSSIEHSVKRHHYLEKLKDEEHSYVEIFENFMSIYSPLFFTAYDDIYDIIHTYYFSFYESRIFIVIPP